MPQLIFIDDSGDPGFKGAASANFVMAAVVFNDINTATVVDEKILKFKKHLGWHDKEELKFSKTNKRVVKSILENIECDNFDIYAIFIKKPKIFNSSYSDKLKIYNWAVEELLKIIPLQNATIRLDGDSNKRYVLNFFAKIRQEINKIYPYNIKKIKLEDSSKNNLIQLADLIAGSINRSMRPDKSNRNLFLGIIKNKVKKIKELKIE